VSQTAPLTPALLVLEDGTTFRGRRFGAPGDAIGEVVFNTSMAGYQEIITDPSYAGQVVVMTYPMIGNYGITPEDFESRRAFLAGLVVKEVSRIPSNWRHDRSLADYLLAQGIPGLCDIDTRALVRHLRERGALRGVIADATRAPDALQARALAHPAMAGSDLASTVSQGEAYRWGEPTFTHAAPGQSRFNVVVYDFGAKHNILRHLVDRGCQVDVVPAKTPAAEILARKPDGVLLSNGPGDPEPVQYAVENIRALMGKVPLFGICLGHQLLSLAAGGKTYKLKFGHRGGNHPVMDLATRKVEITSHNHGFSVAGDSLPSNVEVTHLNLNDQTVEGIRLRDVPAFSVQYHPEAAPGPHDATHLFDRFVAMMADWRKDG